MRNYAKRLISDFLLQEEQQERKDDFASALLIGPEEEGRYLPHARPLAISTEDGWTSALWLSEPDDQYAGQIRVIAKGCRSRKLALITANYYRLHHMINANPQP